jgi:hypothetical protein
MELGYLDAGTGSMIVSAIVAGAAGVGVILRMSWRRIAGFLSPKQRAEGGEEALEPHPQAEHQGVDQAVDQAPAEQLPPVPSGTSTSTEPRA